jgi:nucleoside-diphosphate-sugar epimerase
MVCVAITGVSGLVGQHVLPLLDAAPEIDRIVGLDAREPARRARRFEFHRVDIASAELKPLLDGVDVVVHLASLSDSIPDEALMTRLNVEATRRLLDAAATAGVGRIVRVSTAAVYGAWPDNPIPLTEDAPLRPNAGFVPAVHAAEVERMLVEWRDEHPGSTVTVLRLAPVMGAVLEPRHLPARLVAGRPPLRIRGAAPPVQVVHVDDAAAAVALAVREQLPGAYNVACDSWLSPEDALALLPRRLVPQLPARLVSTALRLAWALGIGDVPASVLPYVVNPWVVANDRLRAAGWEPGHTNEDTLLETSDAVASHAVAYVLAGAGALVTLSASAFMARQILRRRRHRT